MPAMPRTPPAPGTWVVHMNHRNRSALFAFMFFTLGSHMVDLGVGWVVWGLWGFQCFLYPHLIYWRAKHASAPGKAEMQNMLFDTAAFGAWAAALGFPLWITFILLVSATVNLTVFQGLRGTVAAIGTLSVSAACAHLLFGEPIVLETALRTTVLCMVGLMLFLIVVANGAWARSLTMHDTREKVRQGERALQQANEHLTQQLQEINSLQTLLKEQANRDALTGLYNRRYLESTMDRELARCKREGKPLGLLLIDVDHFKKINDTYGHQAGDGFLRAVAAMLQTRSADLACRYGGEEFVLLFPDMPRDVTMAKAEQIRRLCEESTTIFGEFAIQSTLSIGVANYPESGKSAEALIAAADAALYAAKSQGRNRVHSLQAASAPAAAPAVAV